MLFCIDLLRLNGRVEVLKKEGLDGFEDHPDKILGYAIVSYMRKDDGYRMKIEELIRGARQLVKRIYERGLCLQLYIEEYGRDIVPAPMGYITLNFGKGSMGSEVGKTSCRLI